MKLKIPLEKQNAMAIASPNDSLKTLVTASSAVSDNENSGEKQNKQSVSEKNNTISKTTGSSVVRIYQLINISGAVQELVSINHRTYLIDNEERALLNRDGQIVTHWEIELPKKPEQRKETIWEYLTRLGFSVEFIEIHNIYYDFDKDLIRNDAGKDLDLIIQMMSENPELKILLGSHTDSRGQNAYNNALAQKRAQAAYYYLTSGGIASERIAQYGFGENKLVNDCGNDKDCIESAHQLNRRTEFKVAFKK